MPRPALSSPLDSPIEVNEHEHEYRLPDGWLGESVPNTPRSPNFRFVELSLETCVSSNGRSFLER